MVVVVIIGVLASLAVPSIVERLRERRSGQAAQEIAMLYRNARLRALGQGFAVVVHYDSTNGFAVREAIPTAAGGNCFLRQTTCQGPVWWTTAAQYRQVNSFNPDPAQIYQAVTSTVSTLGGATTFLDVCFSPRGRAFSSASSAQPIAPMASAVDVAVTRGGSSQVRHVAILPNGMARVTL